MSVTSLSKEEYLKRYLSGAGGDEGKEKKKKKKKSKNKVAAKALPNVRIIDNDIAFPSVEEEETGIVLSDAEDVEELPAIASVQDDRDIEIQVKEEFEKSGKWKTFRGENIAQKNLINEVIKIEQDDIKPEPLSEDEMRSDFLYPRKKRKIKKEKPDREIKTEGVSPPRRRRHDSDESPPRKRRHDSDESPPRRQRHDSDASPPRRRHDSDASPPRRRHDSDASPPRRRQNSDSDVSPPRRRTDRQEDSDASPPRQRKAASDSDMSPPRRGNQSDSDASPPRMKKTLDGKKAGLQNAKDLKDELAELRQRERKMYEGLSEEMSGKNAKTIVRGRLAEAEKKKEEEKKRKEVPEELKQKYEQWNKGLSQVKAASHQLEDNLYEMSKSLTRTVDDKDREDLLKEREREDDPMAEYMKKKKEKVHGKGRRYPQYSGPQPPANRYGIRPGYRWDGVDRSNGFEKKLLTQGAAKKAQEEEWNRWASYEGD